jgi:ribose/xylose/arabinose/galactoside ABC-type transport system permease subunit
MTTNVSSASSSNTHQPPRSLLAGRCSQGGGEPSSVLLGVVIMALVSNTLSLLNVNRANLMVTGLITVITVRVFILWFSEIAKSLD